MKVALLHAIASVAVLAVVVDAGESPTLQVVSPAPDAIVSGRTRIEVAIDAQSGVRAVNFFADGRLVCTVERPPFACSWDAGPVVRPHHVRVVATFDDGRRVVQNVRTKDLGYTEHASAQAVLVPVVVTHDGEFVRGLKARDFQVFENGVPQPIASFISEDAPLDLVVAIDVSSSMEHALPEVKASVRQLLSRLRPGDAATLLGFNDAIFVVAEREIDSRTRQEAVELLSAFGGTALYDATLRALDLVGQQFGRKGVVIFSDGDDRHSLSGRESVLARVEASDAMLYTIGFGVGSRDPRLRQNLETYARSTGGRAFFPAHATDLDGVFDRIVAELAHQYVLSYSPTNPDKDGRWRDIRVQLRDRRFDVRARRGYRAGEAQQARR
jgi:VWFA-related protein